MYKQSSTPSSHSGLGGGGDGVRRPNGKSHVWVVSLAFGCAVVYFVTQVAQIG